MVFLLASKVKIINWLAKLWQLIFIADMDPVLYSWHRSRSFPLIRICFFNTSDHWKKNFHRLFLVTTKIWKRGGGGLRLCQIPDKMYFRSRIRILIGPTGTRSAFCNSVFKGTVPRRLQVFPWISLPQTPEYLIRAVSIFAAQGAPPVTLTTVANGKNLHLEKF